MRQPQHQEEAAATLQKLHTTKQTPQENKQTRNGDSREDNRRHRRRQAEHI